MEVVILFRMVEGTPEPLLPRGQKPDGKDVVTLEQAAALTGLDVEALRKRWLACCGGIAPATDLNGKEVVDPDRSPPTDEERKLWAAMSDEERDELTRVLLYSNLSPQQFQLFKRICVERGFSVLSRKLHPEVKDGRLLIITTIIALREIADRNDRRNAYEAPVWAGEDGVWHETWNAPEPPAWAKVGVGRRGFKKLIFGKASWASYAPVDRSTGIDVLDPFWQQHGPGQLAKCAEALALRVAFPEDLDGIYCLEEMAQAKTTDRKPPRRGGDEPAMRIVPDSQVSTDDESGIDEPEHVDAEEYESLLNQAGYPEGQKRAAFLANMGGKHHKLARYNKPMFYRVVAKELREIIKRRDDAA